MCWNLSLPTAGLNTKITTAPATSARKITRMMMKNCKDRRASSIAMKTSGQYKELTNITCIVRSTIKLPVLLKGNN